MDHPVEWLAPAPLWDAALADDGTRRFREPALLRYASDGFFDELTGDLAAAAPATPGTGAPAAPDLVDLVGLAGLAGLSGRVARPETWDRPAAGWAPAGDPSLDADLKLYQPVHKRYYLVAASLVCRRSGLPQRKVAAAAGESASLLVRRLVPRSGVAGANLDPRDPSTYAEHAWVGDRSAGRWQPAPADGAPLTGEERLGLFSLPFRDAAGRNRRLHAALLPVAGRELYEGAAPASAPISAPPPAPAPAQGDALAALSDPRKAAWASGPFVALRDLADLSPPPDLGDEIARELLRFALLDLADLLSSELPALWDALVAGSPAGLSAPLAAVFARLDQPALPWGGRWRDALVRAEKQRQVLLGQAPAPSGQAPAIPSNLTLAQIRPAAGLLLGGQFQNALYAAFDAVPAGSQSAGGSGSGVPSPAAGAPEAEARAAASSAGAPGELDGAWYVARCVYERPRCAEYAPPVVSAPSRPFHMAPFFDPDAPARQLTIRLPLDTSIKGLKRFPKGVSMLLSNKLRRQLERVQGAKLSDIDDGNLPDESGWTLGMICSFSLPIITLCAFIVLMIFLQLLNIVFWWLPFLKICLPIPVRSE
jgi:hypothetical protein